MDERVAEVRELLAEHSLGVDEEEKECRHCCQMMETPCELEPTPFCNVCAQEALEKLCNLLPVLLAEREEMKNDLDKSQQALRFYANDETYAERPIPGRIDTYTDIERDEGMIARTALAAKGGRCE
jgi:hypothetical protein